MSLKNKFKQIRNNLTKRVDRIVIVPEKCFSDEEYELFCRGGLTQETMDKINANFNSMVSEVISLSAKGKKIYVECIGTAGEHFITILTLRKKNEE